MFEKLREQNPEFSQKLVPIEGDVTLLELGLKDDDKKAILAETSIVYNLAQVSKCDSHLRYAIIIKMIKERKQQFHTSFCKQGSS